MPDQPADTSVFSITLFALILLILSAINISKLASNPIGETGDVLGNKIDLLNERLYWQELLYNNPTYFQGWLELSGIEIQLGNTQEAKQAFIKAKAINPNFEGF